MFDQYSNDILLALNPYLLTFPFKNSKMMVVLEGGLVWCSGGVGDKIPNANSMTKTPYL